MQTSKLERKKKGQLSMLPEAAIAVGIFVLIVSAMAIILVGFNSSANNSQASTIIGYGITGMTTFGSWTPTIVVIVIAVCIISLIMGFFYMRNKGGRA